MRTTLAEIGYLVKYNKLSKQHQHQFENTYVLLFPASHNLNRYLYAVRCRYYSLSRMDLRAEILREHSKRQCVRIGTWIGKDKKRFSQLMDLFLHDEYCVVQRSAWIVSYCADHHPELITPWLKPMLLKTREPGVHDAVRRNVMRILQYIEIPGSLLGTVITICFEELETPNSPIAVKAFAMTVLAKIARKKPDIIPELRAAVDFATLNATPGIRVRCRKVLEQISDF